MMKELTQEEWFNLNDEQYKEYLQQRIQEAIKEYDSKKNNK